MIGKRLKQLTIFVLPVIAVVALIVVANTTNPIESGPLIILCVFVLLYIFVLSFLVALYNFVSAVTNVLRPRAFICTRRGYYILSIVAMTPVLLVALNTLGKLDIVEAVLVFLLSGLGSFYVARRIKK